MGIVRASGVAQWRDWLARHGRSEREVWLVIQHRGSATPSVGYREAIEHALGFGWGERQARTHDAGSVALRFTPRRPRSTWSRTNRARAAKMIEAGLMAEPGQAMIDLARATGRWEVPSDPAVADELRAALDANPDAARHFAA